MATTKKHVGDVLGISKVPTRASKPGAKTGVKKGRRRRIKGIELEHPRRTMKRAGVVGGVRGRGR